MSQDKKSSSEQNTSGEQTDSVARTIDKLPFAERLKLKAKTLKRLRIIGILYILGIISLLVFFDLETPPNATLGVFIPLIVLLSFIFETMDSAAGMGFGTALSAILLLVFDFEPLAVVPALLISETITGLISGWMHNEFENVAVSFKQPITQETKAVVLITIVSALGTLVSVILAYYALKFDRTFITTYVTFLVFLMAVVALFREHFKPAADAEYKPKRLVGFATLAGFNKGIGGGGYGPVTTMGQLFAGMYEKSAAAISSIAEGFASLVGVAVYFAIEAQGVDLNFMLLPSLLAGSVLASIMAPYSVRIIPNRIYRYIIPGYALAIGIFLLYSLFYL